VDHSEIGAGIVKGMEGSQSDIQAAASKLAGIIREAVKGGVITGSQGDSLVGYIQQGNNRLKELAGERDRIVARINVAKQYAANVRQNTIGYAPITGIASNITQGGGTLTAHGLLSGLKLDLAKIRQFSLALIDGPQSQIKALNRTEGAIQNTAHNLGRELADAMFDAGEQAGKGFLSGLKHQEHAIDVLMAKIDKTMVDRIRKELGIKSPSSVAHWHGLMFAQASLMGWTRAGIWLMRLPVGCRGRVRVRHGAFGHGGGGQGGDINVKIDVHVPGGFVGSNQELSVALAKQVQPALLQLQRRNPLDQLATRQAVG